MALVEERKHLPAIKQVLKLYSSISIAKLAALSEMDEATARGQLDLLSLASSVITWNGGDALAGEPAPCGDIEFEMKKEGGQDMVVVRESKASSVTSDFLVRHIAKFDDIVRDLDSIQLPTPAAAVAAPAVVTA